MFYRITTRVRKLLMLIPTDPAVIEALDSISTRVSHNHSKHKLHKCIQAVCYRMVVLFCLISDKINTG